MVLDQRHPSGPAGIGLQLGLPLLPALGEYVGGGNRLILSAEQRGQLQQRHRRDRRVLERVRVGESTQFIDGAVDVLLLRQTFRSLKSSLRELSALREALQQLLIG